MVTINNFELISNSKLAINVETTKGNTIKNIRLWSMYDYKVDSKAIDISDKLLKISNEEVLIINPEDLGINTRTELLFIEVIDSSVACNAANGVTFNFTKYDKCLLDFIFKEYDVDNKDSLCGSNLNTTTSMTSLVSTLMLATRKSLSLGLYNQAISLIEKLNKICSNNSCGCSDNTLIIKGCNNFNQF